MTKKRQSKRERPPVLRLLTLDKCSTTGQYQTGSYLSEFRLSSLTKEGKRVHTLIRQFVGREKYKGASLSTIYWKWELTNDRTTDRLAGILAVCDRLQDDGYNVTVKDETKEMQEEQHGPQKPYPLDREGHTYLRCVPVNRRFLTLRITLD